MTIPFAISVSAADAIFGDRERAQPDLIPGPDGCEFFEETRPQERESRYGRHPEPSAERFNPARRSTSVRRRSCRRSGAAETHADAVRRRSTQVGGYADLQSRRRSRAGVM